MTPDSKKEKAEGRGRGRPRIALDERRSEKLSAAVNAATRDAFHLVATEVGMTPSDYLRTVIEDFLAKRGGRA